MNDAPIDEPETTRAHALEPHDPLLAALRQLPGRTIGGSAEARLQRRARARYVRSFENTAWRSSAIHFVGRAAVPGLLAGIVGIYMTWAITAAVALVH